jgi:hypothetical protein
VLPSEPRSHVLLIGVDAYPEGPLQGCVNDIDVVQRLLVGKMGVERKQICRLASPHVSATVSTDVPSRPATLTNIREALTMLASDRVRPGDRVFIYYSGHGTRITVGPLGRRISREALVPVDFLGPDGANLLLFDFELNCFLRSMSSRTRAVTLVLDCCHSAGAFRDANAGTARFLPIGDVDERLISGGGNSLPEVEARGFGTDPASVGYCAVIAACQADERAKEMSLDPEGRRHGVFTWALVSCLADVHPAQLVTTTWGQIWGRLMANIAASNPFQTPLLASGSRRPILGGEDGDGDFGIPVAAKPDGSYAVGIGAIAGVGPGASLAVYGVEPPRFPPIGTALELKARLGELRVIAAAPTTGIAVVTKGGPFPDGARGRVLELTPTERLTVEVVGLLRPTIRDELARSQLIQLIDPPGTGLAANSPTGVTLSAVDEHFLLRDELNGSDGSAPLALVPADPNTVRAVLEHCVRHRMPLWFLRHVSDLSGVLSIRLLDCSDPKTFARGMGANPQDPELPEVTSHPRYAYAVREGQKCCVRVENHGPAEMGVALLNCAASGRVEHLGYESIPPQGRHIFWHQSNVGEPMIPESSQSNQIDRLVAIGSTLKGRDLKELVVDETFAEVVARFAGCRGSRDGAGRSFASGSRRPPPPPETWAATSATVILEESERPIDEEQVVAKA